MTLCDLARQWFTLTKFASYDEMKKKFTQEYSEYGKTLHEWLKSWTELRFRPDTDNIDEYIQKFSGTGNTSCLSRRTSGTNI